MRVEILKPFTCSRDGGSTDLKPGIIFDVPDRLIDALDRGGYVRRIDESALAPTDGAEGDAPSDDDASDASTGAPRPYRRRAR
jgi:hypothetical protein